MNFAEKRSFRAKIANFSGLVLFWFNFLAVWFFSAGNCLATLGRVLSDFSMVLENVKYRLINENEIAETHKLEVEGTFWL